MLRQQTIYKKETFSLRTLCGSEASQLQHSPIRADKTCELLPTRLTFQEKLPVPSFATMLVYFTNNFIIVFIDGNINAHNQFPFTKNKSIFSSTINSQFPKLQIQLYPQLELLNRNEKTKLTRRTTDQVLQFKIGTQKCIRRQLVSTNRELSRFYYLPRK